MSKNYALYAAVSLLLYRTEDSLHVCSRTEFYDQHTFDGAISDLLPLDCLWGRTVRCAKSWLFSTTGSSVSSEG